MRRMTAFKQRGLEMKHTIIALLALFVLLSAGAVGARDSATFRYTLNGAVTGEDTTRSQIKNKNTVLWSSFNPGPALDISFFHAEEFDNGSGANCFAGGEFDGPFQILQERDGSALLHFYFEAFDNNGQGVHKYVLTLLGEYDDPLNFPPAQPGSGDSDVLFQSDAWDMTTEGRGQDRKVTCTGDSGEPGRQPFYTEINIERLD